MPAPLQCITLVEVASHVMGSHAAAPEAASVLLPSICKSLSAVGRLMLACAHQSVKVHRPLLASVKVLLHGLRCCCQPQEYQFVPDGLITCNRV